MAQTGYTPILIYSSSTAAATPSAGNLTNSTLGSELAINITDGKLFYKDNANAVQVIGWKIVPTTAGGTGLTSYTAGDLMYYASGTAFTKLAIGASGRWLGSSGSAPQWNAPAALTKTDDTNVTLTLGGSASTALLNAASLTLGWTGQLAVTRGGTGLSTVVQGDILYASAADTLARLAKNTTATRYLANTGTSNNPQWDQVNLANGVTGTLPVGNGGTGLASWTANGLVYASGTTTLANSANLTYNGAGIVDLIQSGSSTNSFIRSRSSGSAARSYLVAEGSYQFATGTEVAGTFYGYFDGSTSINLAAITAVTSQISNSGQTGRMVFSRYVSGGLAEAGRIDGNGWTIGNGGAGQSGYQLAVYPTSGNANMVLYTNGSQTRTLIDMVGRYYTTATSQSTINFSYQDTSSKATLAQFYSLTTGTTAATTGADLVCSTAVAGTLTESWRTDRNAYFLIGYTASNGAYRLQVNSQIYATSATIATSDANYKIDPKPITNALDLINKLNPVSFSWKQGEQADGVRNPNYGKQMPDQDEGVIDNRQWLREPHAFPEGKTIGFLAQEVQQALADTEYVNNIVKTNSRPAVHDVDGKEIAPESKFMGIAEGNLIALLTKAVQELTEKVNALEAKANT